MQLSFPFVKTEDQPSSVWDSLTREQQLVAVETLARLITQAAQIRPPQEEQPHEQ